jgi:hypothetical protein
LRRIAWPLTLAQALALGGGCDLEVTQNLTHHIANINGRRILQLSFCNSPSTRVNPYPCRYQRYNIDSVERATCKKSTNNPCQDIT